MLLFQTGLEWIFLGSLFSTKLNAPNSEVLLQESTDFEQYFPLSLMETGHDILFFWVARMVMMGHIMTDSLPFKVGSLPLNSRFVNFPQYVRSDSRDSLSLSLHLTFTGGYASRHHMRCTGQENVKKSRKRCRPHAYYKWSYIKGM